MVEPVRIEPTAVYDDGALYMALGLSETSLANARRSRSLRYKRVGSRILYLGQWVLDWLGHDETKPARQQAEVSHAG